MREGTLNIKIAAMMPNMFPTYSCMKNAHPAPFHRNFEDGPGRDDAG